MPLLLRVRRPLGAAALRRALAGVSAHHRALRPAPGARPEGEWTQAYAAPGEGVPFERVDLSGLPEAEQAAAVTARSAEVQRTLDLERGPLLRAVFFDPGAGREARLLLAAHHLVVDGVSWRVLLEDLETACGQVERGEAVGPGSGEHVVPGVGPAPGGARAEGRLRGGAGVLGGGGAGGDRSAARGIAPRARTPRGPRGRSTVCPRPPRRRGRCCRRYRRRTGRRSTTCCCARWPGRSRRWTGEERLLVQMEGHGREEELFTGVDLTRTVGWFTTLYPVLLDVRGAAGPGERLKAVKEQLRALPGHGLGYGALRYLGSGEARAALGAQPEAEVHFEYLGQVDGSVSGEALFALAPELAGAAMSPDGVQPQVLGVERRSGGRRAPPEVALRRGAAPARDRRAPGGALPGRPAGADRALHVRRRGRVHSQRLPAGGAGRGGAGRAPGEGAGRRGRVPADAPCRRACSSRRSSHRARACTWGR